MKIRGKCESCKKVKWFIKKRTYNIAEISAPVTSKGLLCLSCFREIGLMIKG